MPNTHEGIVATYKNHYGETKKVRRTRFGWRVEYESPTDIIRLGRAIGAKLGVNIRKARQGAGMTMDELGRKAGLSQHKPKHRIFEIEKAATRRTNGDTETCPQSIKLGTLYALAAALDVEPASLLPPLNEVLFDCDMGFVSEPKLGCKTKK